jgi:predicted MPP superfamily phosphohydrolase
MITKLSVPEKNLTHNMKSVMTDNQLINQRTIWAANRFWMETENMKTKKYGGKSHHHWYSLLLMTKLFKTFLHLTGRYKKGFHNARNIELRELDLRFSNLPSKFESFTILHLSDLHFGCIPDIEDIILKQLNNQEVDICVITGDYLNGLHVPINNTIESLRKITKGIRTRYGFLGILGNHDTCHMVTPMEDLGIRMLINENYRIHKEGDYIQFIGTDDVHYYYTDQAMHAMENAVSDFSIALVHSPELFDMAAEMGVDLYLCGHTHGGQVCLPGGIPVIKHLNRGKDFYSGHWHYHNLQGVTSCGVGTSGIPVRFNTRGELLILKLYRGEIGEG